MAELIPMHRFDDGHEVKFDRLRVVMIEPGPDINGTIIILDTGATTRKIHVRDGYYTVRTELHMSLMERAIRDYNESPPEVPFREEHNH